MLSIMTFRRQTAEISGKKQTHIESQTDTYTGLLCVGLNSSYGRWDCMYNCMARVMTCADHCLRPLPYPSLLLDNIDCLVTMFSDVITTGHISPRVQ